MSSAASSSSPAYHTLGSAQSGMTLSSSSSLSLRAASDSTDVDAADRATGDALRATKAAPFEVGRFIRSHMPVTTWLPAYDLKRQLPGDLIAGVTVGLMVIPQGLGYAGVAGVPQIYGLYSAFMGVFVYALFGGCRDISVGPTAILSLISIDANGGDVDVAIQMTLLAGLFQMSLAIFQLGRFVDFISHPVLSGFTSAAAIQIAVTQVGSVCGYKTRSAVYDAAYDFFSRIGETNFADLLLGVGAMILLHIMSKLKSRYPNSAVMAQICIGRNALIVLLTALLSFLISLSHTVPWKLVGKIPSGLPSPQVPEVSEHTLKHQMGNVALSAFVGFLESIAIAKAFARQNGYAHKLSANQELFTIGLANTIGSFFRSLPVTGSFSRTAVASQAGARTQLQGVVTGIVVLLALVLLTPAFKYIPTTVLAAVVIVAALNLVDVSIVGDLWRLGRLGRLDLFSLLVSFVGCLFLDIQYGIAIGIAVSIAITLYQMARPPHVVLESMAINDNEIEYLNHDREVGYSFVPEYEAASARRWSTALTGARRLQTPVTVASSGAAPDDLLLLRIDSSIVFFNQGHLVDLIGDVELARFALVPMKPDLIEADQEAAATRETRSASLATNSTALLAASESSSSPHMQAEPAPYDPDNELGLPVLPAPAIAAISNPEPGVQGLEEMEMPSAAAVAPDEESPYAAVAASMGSNVSSAAMPSLVIGDVPYASETHAAPFSSHHLPAPRLRPCRMRVLLLDCSAVNVLDTSGVRGLHQLARDLGSRPQPVSVHFACVKSHLVELLAHSLQPPVFPLGAHAHLHRTVASAVDAIRRHQLAAGDAAHDATPTPSAASNATAAP